jgi:hypothetical protein
VVSNKGDTMKKITKKMVKEAESGARKPWMKKWDKGVMLNVSMDWDSDNYAISASEVQKALAVYLSKWSGIKKYHLDGKPIVIQFYVR